MLAASDRFMDRLVCQTAGMQRPVLAGDCVRAAYDLTERSASAMLSGPRPAQCLANRLRPCAWC